MGATCDRLSMKAGVNGGDMDTKKQVEVNPPETPARTHAFFRPGDADGSAVIVSVLG